MTVEIGGKKLGRRAAQLTYHVRGYDPSDDSEAARAAASGLVMFVDALCGLLVAVHAGRFDRRYRDCAWNHQQRSEYALTYETWVPR